MPRIFDNIEQSLLPALQQTLEVADRADFCVGYFNMRGWKKLDRFIERWSGGEGNCCRLMVGMQKLPADELRDAVGLIHHDEEMDNATAVRMKKKLADEFRTQLTYAAPNNDDEAALRRLAEQIKAKKVIVKLFLRHRLHAKLYLLFRPQDPVNKIIGYLGSSNLTVSGLSSQGELNVDVMDHDACQKLANWFDARWDDRWCIDISAELVEIIEQSWARPSLIPPYHIYVNMAYHLSQEALAGLAEFSIPAEFHRKLWEFRRRKLFKFQEAAVLIAARHLNKRGGVLIGDVVGFGKTLTATALACIFEEMGMEALILCPKNLVPMWEEYREQFLKGKVLSLSKAIGGLKDLRRYKLVLIDESHNLRNREGRRYRAIADYIDRNDSKCILLSATPYNKTYLDLASQLRLFVAEAADLGIRPEQLLRQKGETEFVREFQCSPRSLAAFEKSPYPDDWRELMRLYLVRRTRTFIKTHYATTDQNTGRKYLSFEDGAKAYFPERVPKTVKFKIGKPEQDQYARLYSDAVVDTIDHLNLPRYGLGKRLASPAKPPATQTENEVIRNLSRAGRRLKGFCRSNLFKRLESSGQAFLQSVERHILRNYVFLHAIDSGLPIPIGTQDAEMLDPGISDEELPFDEDEDENGNDAPQPTPAPLRTEAEFRERAAEVYASYIGSWSRRFKWLRAHLFVPQLAADLRADIKELLKVLKLAGDWNPAADAKLNALTDLLANKHTGDKVLVFTQFADTVYYLERELHGRGVTSVAGVTGDCENPTSFAWRFSPVSNEKRKRIPPDREIRVLIATDVLSEGQNLQDCSVVVNFDLPWAIIRLVQRAGRVDRIGQIAESILCYSFLPADGIERIIRLRTRVRQRLTDNADAIGSDEAFFEGDDPGKILDLFHEKPGILDGDADGEVDLASYALQIWKNAIAADPSLETTIKDLSPVVFGTKSHPATDKQPAGVLVYLKTADDNDALAWMDKQGRSVTESQYAILKAAECTPDTPALPRQDDHHALVEKGVELIVAEQKTVGGQLGRPSGARYKTYQRLEQFLKEIKSTVFRESLEVERALQDIHRYPLRQSAIDTLNRRLRAGIRDEDLAQLVIDLRKDGGLSVIHEDDEETREPQIICSLGLASPPTAN